MSSKGIALALLLFTCTGATSQVIRLGVNLANVTVTNDGLIDEANTLVSFHAGILGSFKFFPLLSVQSGFIFTGKGSRTQSGEVTDPTYFRATSNPFYIEVPVCLIIKSPGPIKLFAGAGSYVAMGVAGKNKSHGKVSGVSFSRKKEIVWSNDDPRTLSYEEGAGLGIMKKFDYGVLATAGVESKKSVLSVQISKGLARLQSIRGDVRDKHRVFSVAFGFKL